MRAILAQAALLRLIFGHALMTPFERGTLASLALQDQPRDPELAFRLIALRSTHDTTLPENRNHEQEEHPN